jgi:beta-galactosidase
VLGVYGGDFYAGTPALTVHRRGKGRAYFIAARTGGDFLDDFYRRLTTEAGIRPRFEELPEGVSVQVRGDGEEDAVFLMNFTNEKKQVQAGHGKAGIDLEPFGVKILQS